MTHGRTHDQRDQHVAFVHEILSDVTILVEAWALARSDALLESLPRDYTVIHQNPFTVLTRLPVIEARPLVSHEHSRIALLILDATEMLGRDLVIYAIDLPSNPRMSRANLTAEVRQFLEDADAPPPDLVIGDCNMTRPSASLGALFPAMHHAFTDGGHGYAASYHRAFPLYHIDHVLLTDDLRSPRYDLLDPGFGRHLAQRAWIADALTE